jgi:hypothetical protein
MVPALNSTLFSTRSENRREVMELSGMKNFCPASGWPGKFRVALFSKVGSLPLGAIAAISSKPNQRGWARSARPITSPT